MPDWERELEGLDAEIQHHIELETQANVERGMPPVEARRTALLKFGNPTRVLEDTRSVWISRWWDDFRSDVIYGVRGLSRTPWLTLAVITTLGIGIGANTAIFSVVNGWLFRPLSVPAPEQLVVLASVEQGRRDAQISFPNFVDLRAQASDSFRDLFAFGFRIAGLNAGGTTQQFVMGTVSGNYFHGLGVEAARGRLFLPSEGELAGDAALLVLSYRYWKNRFGGDEAVIGAAVTVNGRTATIVGVAPESFQGTVFGFPVDGYITLSGSTVNLMDRSSRSLNVLGRRKAGVTLARSQATIDVIARRLADEYPESNKGVRIRVIPEPLARPVPLVADFVPAIAGLFLFLPALLLLMACLNVTGIALARGEARSRQMALRAALGASRGRLIRQLFVDGLLLSIGGTLAGVALGGWCVRMAGEYVQEMYTSVSNYRVSMDAGLDGRVFGYSLLCAIGAAVLTGLWPGLRASRVDLRGVLNGGGTAVSNSRGRRRMYKALVVVQLAGSVLLLVVSTLFLGSLREARRIDLGFDPQNTVALMVDPGQLGYDRSRTHSLYRDLRDGLRAIPGVQSVGIAQTVPMTFLSSAAPVYVDGVPPPTGQTAPPTSFNTIDENYLATMRTPIVSGRDFGKQDCEGEPRVAIVNETMAARLWPNSSPIGKVFSLHHSGGPLLEVIGVSKNGQYKYLTSERESFFYLPMSQSAPSARTLVIRTEASAESLMPAIRAVVRGREPELLINTLMTLEQITQGPAGLFLLRMAATLSGTIGLLGLGLAVIGTYGVVAYGVSRREREFGIRMALGADRATIRRLVLGEGLRMGTVGIGVGLVGALLAKKGIGRLLVTGASETSPLLYAAVCLTLIAVVLAASYLPAHASARVDPVEALRCD